MATSRGRSNEYCSAVGLRYTSLVKQKQKKKHEMHNMGGPETAIYKKKN